MKPYIEANNISKVFFTPKSTIQSTHALEDINLQVSKGSFTTIVGPSGCGKSTLLQILAGLVQPSSGEVRLDGRVIKAPPFEMVYLFQQYTRSLLPWKTMTKNVSFGIENRRLDEEIIRSRVERAIELVGLRGFENHYPWQLSGGMQQRAAIARALVCEPQVLLLDEPFSSIDALTRGALQDQLLLLWRSIGLIILFVTHDIEEAVYLSDRVLVMGKAPGRMIDEVEIDLPYPRHQIATKEHAKYLELRRYIYSRILI